MTDTDVISARNKRIGELEARLKTEEHAVSILTRSAEQWKERAKAAEARVAELERKRIEDGQTIAKEMGARAAVPAHRM